MSAWSITVERDELERVAAVLSLCAPTETDQDGVWVQHRNGVRVWSCISGFVQWEITGGAATSHLDARCLPGRLVWHAREFAFHSSTETVTISTPDEVVGIAECEIGSAVIDLPASPDEPHFPDYVTDTATATTTVAALFNLVSRTRIPPIGAADADDTPVTLVIDEALLATTIDWAGHGGFRSTYRIPASTTGTGRCVIPPGAVIDLLRNLDSDEEITVRLPEDPALPLLVFGENMRATISRRETGARRFDHEVGQLLANATGRPCRNLDRGVFATEFAHRTVRVELADTPAETIRVTTAVCRDLDVSFEVLAQINDLNAGLVGAKVWIADGVVVAGLDVPCTSLSEIGSLIAELDRQLDGLDVFLSALGQAA